MVSGPPGRAPDFVIVGAMKCATTTAFRWLGEHPDVWLPDDKEPNFCSHDDRWRRGAAWYGSLFAPSPRSAVTGEASTTYLDPAVAAVAAHRLHGVAPDARLLCLVRDPVDRAVSHSWHAVRQRQERRPPTEALAARDDLYVRRSRYAAGLRPFVDVFGRDRVLAVVADDLMPDSDAWRSVLAHLGLRPHAPSGVRYNVHEHGSRLRRPARILARLGPQSRPLRVPAGARRTVGRSLMRRPRRPVPVGPQVPEAVRKELAADARALAILAGWDSPPWAWCT